MLDRTRPRKYEDTRLGTFKIKLRHKRYVILMFSWLILSSQILQVEFAVKLFHPKDNFYFGMLP